MINFQSYLTKGIKMNNKEIKEKIKAFSQRHKKTSKILLLLAIFVAISLVSLLILSLTGVVYFDGGMKIHHEFFADFINEWYGSIIIIVIQIVITSLLSFVPGASMMFIILMQSLYEDSTTAFIVAFSGVILTSLAMYLIGRFGGYNLGKWLIGEEDCKKASDLLNHKGLIYFPMMMMFPIFPDDALVMMAGTLRMSLKWFIPSVVIGRGIGVATIVFGISIIPLDENSPLWQWIIFVLLCALFIVGVFYLANKFNSYMEKKSKTKK